MPTFTLCSRQESNLERWYRKPAFYPLNYESKRVVKRKFTFFCTASAALASLADAKKTVEQTSLNANFTKEISPKILPQVNEFVTLETKSFNQLKESWFL